MTVDHTWVKILWLSRALVKFVWFRRRIWPRGCNPTSFYHIGTSCRLHPEAFVGRTHHHPCWRVGGKRQRNERAILSGRHAYIKREYVVSNFLSLDQNSTTKRFRQLVTCIWVDNSRYLPQLYSLACLHALLYFPTLCPSFLERGSLKPPRNQCFVSHKRISRCSTATWAICAICCVGCFCWRELLHSQSDTVFIDRNSSNFWLFFSAL